MLNDIVYHHVTYVTRKTTLNFPDNVSNMTYSLFESLAHVYKLLVTQLHNFSIYFFKCIEFLLLHILLSVSHDIS